MIVFNTAADAIEEAVFCADSEHIPYVIVFDDKGFGVCKYDDVEDISLVMEYINGTYV
ncbi:hypothetical protein N9W96_02240 [Flavobacteriaceae bacterium]|jgi:hypothetical protein|nr:hypothetical protein [Flavobacteriaceae bacterium]|tara:strand:- start:180 stop:353 length:174 start_codon:yes stop_codon:yes gene_type:complete